MTSSVYVGDVTQTTWSLSTAVAAAVEDERSERRYWTLVLVIIPALTLFGNVLVVLSVWREMALRTATNYFIVSLAVADIMVAVLVMPLAVYVEVLSAPCLVLVIIIRLQWSSGSMSDCSARGPGIESR